MRIPVMLRRLLAIALPLAACSVACSSSSPANGGTGGSGGAGGSGGSAQDSGIDPGLMAADSGAGTETNPYGVPYPTANIGVSARMDGMSASGAPGSVMQNYKFLGYINTDPGTPTSYTGSPQVISLADYYDPAGKKYKVLHLNVAANWCSPCNMEADALTAPGAAAGLATDGAAVLSLLTEGYDEGTGATLNDLTSWIKSKGVDYNMGVDPEAANLGVFFSEAAIPWNADLDARTMEILDQGVGFDGMIVQDIQGWVTWVNNHPPSYGCPTGYSLSGNKCVAK
jgi:hypothetical protein